MTSPDPKTYFCLLFSDPKTESRLPLLNLDIYVPRDERFSQVKLSDFIAYALKSAGQVLVAGIRGFIDKTPTEFDTFQDILDLYEGGIKKPNGVGAKGCIPFAMVKELARSDGEKPLKFPVPDVINGIFSSSLYLYLFIKLKHLNCCAIRKGYIVIKDGVRKRKVINLLIAFSVDKSAWRTDEEFGREMLAGVNPIIIRRLQVI